jgi:hypothetical protein
MKIIPWEDLFLVVTDEGMVNVLEGWIRSLVTSSIEPVAQMDLLQSGVIKKSTELTHPPLIEFVITLVFGLVHHVEITAY